jgi:predicted metalloprotease with PDZ domain
MGGSVIKGLLVAILIALAPLRAPAQVVYSANQIPAGGVEIAYEVTTQDPISHIYDVELNVRGLRTPTMEVSMPAWAPGAYRISNYAKNVQDFRPATARGQTLKWEQIDKQTWRIQKQPVDDVTIRYQLFSPQLNDEMANITGPALFMYVVGQKHVPVSVKYDMPDGWRVYTGLEKKGDRYYGRDYDIFVDGQTFIGKMKVVEFEAGGVNHRIVFSKPDISVIDQQVISDLTDIIETEVKIFGKAPFSDYTFLIEVLPAGSGGGGLEHLNSTRITVGENDFVNQTSYRRFLFVAAHEYFHAWNVKRIRPEPLGPFDYTKEVYTRLLWFFEGVTDYYANLVLARADIVLPTEFLSRVSIDINGHQHQAGRSLMSAEEASLNTWAISDNNDNNSISYYTKGGIIGLLLDLEIRDRTKNQKSLDDVMRYLMVNFADKGIGVSESGVLDAIEAVTGSDFDEFYETNVRSRRELDYNRHLGHAGLRMEVAKQPSSIYIGVQYTRDANGLARIQRITPNSPAQRAKLDVGDVLIAMNGERLTYDNFVSRLHEHGVGETIKLQVLRQERLIAVDIIPTDFQDDTWSITEARNATPQQLELRRLWLGDK